MKLLSLYLFFGWLFLISPTTLWAQSPQSIQFQKQHFVDLHSVLTEVSRQAKVSFVVEGEKADSLLPKNEETVKQVEELCAKTVDISQGVTKSALIFDYDTEQVRPNLFLLRRRYTSPNTLPYVSISEAEEVLKRIQRIIDSQFPRADIPVQANSATFVGLFPEQWIRQPKQSIYEQSEQTPFKNIPLGKLSSEQQSLVWNFAGNYYFGETITKSNRAIELLNTTKNPNSLCVFQWFTEYSQPFFGFTLPKTITTSQGTRQVIWNFLLSHGAETQLTGGIIFPSGYNPNTKAESAPLLDPSAPSSEKSDKETTPMPILTLEKATAQLSSKDITYSVHPDLAGKPVSLVGKNHAVPQDIAEGMAALFGLRLAKNSEKEYRITYPVVRTPRKIEELPSALLEQIPLSLVRLWEGVTKKQREVLRSEAANQPSNPQLAIRTQSLIAGQLDSESKAAATKAIWNEATRRIRTEIEPRLADFEGKFPLSEASDSVQRMLVLITFCDLIPDLKEFAKSPVPPFLSEFNKTILAGKTEVFIEKPDKAHLSLQLLLAMPDGGTTIGPNIGVSWKRNNK